MKPKLNRFFSAAITATFALSSSAFAAQLFKDPTTTDINTLVNWSTVNGADTPDPLEFGTADQLRFNENTAATGTFTMDLSAALSVGDLTVDSGTGGGGIATGNFVIDSANNSALTLNGGGNPSYTTSGIVLNSGTGGTLTVNCDIALGATPVRFTVSRALTVNGDIALGANELQFNTAGSTTTLAGVISGTGALNKAAGAQILALTNTANTFSGAVTLVGGTTQVTKLAIGGADSSIGKGTGSILLNGATLTYTGAGGDTTDRAIDMRAGAAINNNSATGAISFTAANVAQGGTASARTLTLGGSNTNANTLGSILGDSGASPAISTLQKSGLGTWVVSGTHTYTGGTIINQGTLRLSGAAATLGGTSGLTTDAGNIWFTSVNAGAALEFELAAQLGVADQIRFRNTGGTAGLGGALVYTGTTAQTLSKTIQCDSSIGIRLESNSVGGKLTFDGPFSQTNRRIYLGGTGTGDNTLATAFAGTGGITKRGAGTWILTAGNTFSGAAQVEEGKLTLGASDTLATPAVTIGAATLSVGTGFTDTVGTLDPTAAATINLGTGAKLAFAASNGVDWDGGTLNITGNFVPGDLGSIRFGLTNAGLTGDQLLKISAPGYTGFGLDVNGYLTATVSSSDYTAWKTANSTAQTIDQDHDNDGVSNGVEFFLGGPNDTTGFTAQPAITGTSVTYAKHSGYPGTYGTHFVIETSETLAGAWTPETVGGNVTQSGDNFTYTFPGGGPAKKFVRLKVTGP